MKSNQKVFFFYAFFSLFFALFAQETQVEIVFKDGTSIKGVLLNYGERSYQIQINGQTQTFSEKDIQAVRFEDKNNKKETPTPEKEPAKKSDLESILRETKITLDFQATPLEEVLNFIQVVTDLNMVISPEIDLKAPISLTVSDVQLKTVFSLLKFLTPIEYETRGKVLTFVSASKDLKKETELSSTSRSSLETISKDHPEIFEKFRKFKLTLQFKDTAVDEIIHFLQDLTGQNILIHPLILKQHSEKKLLLSITVQDLDFYSILEMIEGVLKLKFVLVNQEVLLLTLPVASSPKKD
ncbi:MAG: hypothetical protein AABZ60_25280 [Planctomycetota bacterium]